MPNCAILQRSLPDNPHKAKAPFDGVIRKWRYRTVVDQEDYELRLRVVSKQDNGKFRFVRRSKPGLVDGPGRHSFRTDLRVRKGDFIALQLSGADDVIARGFYIPSPGATTAAFFPAPANGEAARPIEETNNDVEHLYNATVKRKG